MAETNYEILLLFWGVCLYRNAACDFSDIYVIIVFVIVAISSCIGACVRHRRNQMFLEQQRQLMQQGVAIQTANGAANPGRWN